MMHGQKNIKLADRKA